MTAPAAETLAAFATGLRYEDIPADVIERARLCVLDTAAVTMFGARFPWSRAIAQFAARSGAPGPCTLLGVSGVALQPAYAALVNGAAAHAFEQDSLRAPGAGVHPGATLLPAALAIAQERGASMRELIAAFVAGCEVLFRIGDACRHSSEGLGFHAPGLTGPYGAAVAAGKLMGLGPAQLTAALGIAGSLSAGLLAFTHAQKGTSVKRLHMGRAAEAGVLAAKLAAEGFDGPETVLEGQYGFLHAYGRNTEPARLTAGLGSEWETRKICFKRYPCHITAHTPIEAVRGLMVDPGFAPEDVEKIVIEGAEKLRSHHDIRDPGDIMQAQYSVPFCVALALYRDPLDPRSFDDEALRDARIRDACRKIQLVPHRGEPASSWHTRVTVTLRGGSSLQRDQRSFPGMPDDPVSAEAIQRKCRVLTSDVPGSQQILDRLGTLDGDEMG